MSQQVQTTQITKNGTSNNSAKTTAETTTKRRGRPPKEETIEVKPAVEPVKREYKYFADDASNLDVIVSRAKVDPECPVGPNGIKRVYCTAKVLEQMLMAQYKGDPYFIYKDVCLADVDKIQEADRKDGRNYNDMVFRGK